MSDWSMYELEDIVWDDFRESDDHIVPRPGGEQVGQSIAQGDFHKKPRYEVGSAVGRSSNNNGSTSKIVLQEKEESAFHSSLKDEKSSSLECSWSHASKTVIPLSHDSECTHDATALTSQETKKSKYCFNGPNIDTGSTELRSSDRIRRNMDIADGNKLGDFVLDDISPANTDLDFLENGHQQRENSDLLDYEWPDMGNFEDVDRLFRNCDSTFGQGSTGTADEISWFSSSSHAVHGSKDTFELGFQSSSSGLSALKSSSTCHAVTMNFLPENDLPTNVCDNPCNLGYHPYAGCLDTDAETKGKSAPGKQVTVQRKLPKSQYQSEGKRDDLPSEYTVDSSLHGTDPIQQLEDKECISSAALSSQSYPSRIITHQKQFWGSDAVSQLHPYSQYVEVEGGHHSVTQSTSCIKSENETNPSLSYKISAQALNCSHQSVERFLDPPSKLLSIAAKEKTEQPRHRQQLRDTLTTGHQSEQFVCQSAFRDQASVQRRFYKSQNEVGCDNELDETGFEIPGFELDSTTIQESSCMASVLSDDISLGLASFRKLQDVMNLLDLRTKLCIRDGLYRLAKSAEHRHNFDSTNHGGRESRDTGRIPGMEESKSGGFMDVETGTNSIDRSIAHLLFHRTSESSRSPDDAMSLESHALNEQKHDPVSDLPVIPDYLVCQEDFGGCIDRKLLCSEEQ